MDALRGGYVKKKSELTQMPELVVFAKAAGFGFLIAETLRVTYIGGSGFATDIDGIHPVIRLFGVACGLALFAWYAFSRGLVAESARLARSRRADLLLVAVLGIFANSALSPSLHEFHASISKLSVPWGVLLLSFLIIVTVSALARAWLSRTPERAPQIFFLDDEEIRESGEDVLANQEQAVHFAETVLASGSNSGLVYGIDGPWGTGKTSFVNMAQDHWRKQAAEEVVIFRFEPLRYAGDPDLADRFIRDLSQEIQRQLFVPEFRPAASRYSRMVKGKADFSFLGFKLALEPSAETIDELLDDIDAVLQRIKRRVIVIVDDLDRLDAKAVNNVLFTIRRTFKLTRAAYILCYDTEILAALKDDEHRARQFLEKFVNIKFSLFVDSAALRQFLRRDWSKQEANLPSIPSDTMSKLESLLGELANILEGPSAAKYMALLGDMRKLKRFVNAVLAMQIEKTNLARTDFDRRDLINLVLLHLNYPGVFRRIYVEETDGRSGFFSVYPSANEGGRKYQNSSAFESFRGGCLGPDRFLLDELFACDSLKLGAYGTVEESTLASRACFNQDPYRNLEKYLKLIVRFTTPEPRDTFKLYQDAVARVAGGAPIELVLDGSEFDLSRGEIAHDQFWRILVSQSYDFNERVARDAIETLVKYLPRYSSVDSEDRGLRQRSIYNLVRLLDRAGWGRTSGKRRANTSENIIEIAHRIFGDGRHSGRSLLRDLVGEERGALGWYDLLLFRLQCSADRLGQVFNLHSALVLHDDAAAQTTGEVRGLAIRGMRILSQRVFTIFWDRYISPGRNVLDDLATISDAELMGAADAFFIHHHSGPKLAELLAAARGSARTFVLYQLANRESTNGAGIGCGYYDRAGSGDGGEIAALVNDYLFDVCFNPALHEKNAEHFLDYCLSRFSSGFWSGDDEDGYHPTPQELSNGLDAAKLGAYWAKYGPRIKAGNYILLPKRVITANYVATYANDLPRTFAVLDQIQMRTMLQPGGATNTPNDIVKADTPPSLNGD